MNFGMKYPVMLGLCMNLILLWATLMSYVINKIKWGGVVFKYSRLARFNNILATNNCIELEFFGKPFSWRKKRGGDDNTLERIDKAIASPSWFNLFTSSDHRQVPLKLNSSIPTKAPPFRFEKMWCMRKLKTLMFLFKNHGVIRSKYL